MNIEQLRKDTPACEDILHFNNAGASLIPDPVYRAVIGHLALERDIGAYEAAEKAQGQLDSLYTNLARLINADPAEIAYVENATRAWDMAFYSLPLQPGNRVITHSSEYASNFLAFLHVAKTRGIEIDIAPSDSHGQIDVNALPALISKDTRAIAITHVPTQGGLVNPAAEVGRIAKQYGLIYVLDACQSVGQLNVDVKEIGCDVLSATGRKFLRGPRGTGFLWVRAALAAELDPPFIDLHAATWTSAKEFAVVPGTRRFENWESYVAGRCGLAVAAQYANDIGLKAIEGRVTQLAASLRERLADLNGIKIHDQGLTKCSIVTFTSDRKSPGEICRALNAAGINVSVSLSEYSQLDLGARRLPAVVRASVHYYNTAQEIETFVGEIARVTHR